VRAVRTLDDEREDDHAARRLRSHELVRPTGLVLREDLADRVVLPAVAAERLEHRADGLLDGRGAERLRELEPEIRGALAEVALGQTQRHHALRPQCTRAQAGGDARVDPA